MRITGDIPSIPGKSGIDNRPLGQVQGAQGFDDVLRKSVNAVSGQAEESNVLADGLISGDHAKIHETMIAMEKAGISMRLMVRVQNKVIEAYQEVMRMQL